MPSRRVFWIDILKRINKIILKQSHMHLILFAGICKVIILKGLFRFCYHKQDSTSLQMHHCSSDGLPT